MEREEPLTGFVGPVSGPEALLLDIDGCIVSGIGREALPGAPEAVARLRRERPVRFVTNTTSRTRKWLHEALLEAGFELEESDVVTPTALARSLLTARGEARGILLADESSRGDLEWFEETEPEAARSVLVASEAHDRKVGDLGRAVLALRAGARLYTLQQNRIYRRDGRVLTDLGPVAAFLGYAADVEWQNLGKPSRLLFETVARELGCDMSALAMVGDDAEFDASGALRAGVGAGILVRTGKYRPGDERCYDPTPSLTLDSIADLPEALAGRRRDSEGGC